MIVFLRASSGPFISSTVAVAYGHSFVGLTRLLSLGEASDLVGNLDLDRSLTDLLGNERVFGEKLQGDLGVSQIKDIVM